MNDQLQLGQNPTIPSKIKVAKLSKHNWNGIPDPKPTICRGCGGTPMPLWRLCRSCYDRTRGRL